MTEDDVVGACLALARADDPNALRELVSYMQPLVQRIVRSNQPHRTDCDDLVQIVLIKALSHLDQYSGKVPFRHWLGRIAVNTCINAIRHERRRPELRDADLAEGDLEIFEMLGSAARCEELARHAATRELVQILLDSLKPEDRLIMALAFLEGYSLEEVAGMTNLTEGTVKMRISRAKEKMRAAYDRLNDTPPKKSGGRLL